MIPNSYPSLFVLFNLNTIYFARIWCVSVCARARANVWYSEGLAFRCKWSSPSTALASYHILLFPSPDGHRVASNSGAHETTCIHTCIIHPSASSTYAYTYTAHMLRHYKSMCGNCGTVFTMLKTMYVVCIPLQDRVDAPAHCISSVSVVCP